MTGDWIIFAKHEGQNFYLGLATHEEAMPQVADQLYDKLRGGALGSSHFYLSEAAKFLPLMKNRE
jgi:hypothetical protein